MEPAPLDERLEEQRAMVREFQARYCQDPMPFFAVGFTLGAVVGGWLALRVFEKGAT